MSHPHPLPITVVSAKAGTRFVQAIRDIIEYRELFYAFVTRDIQVRYKQTFLGVAWVLLQPLVTGFVFAFVFGLVSGRFDGMTTILFFMAGLVPWTSFQSGVTLAAQSMETHANLVSKVYFPRVVIPGAHVLGSVLDFAIAFSALLLIALVAAAPSPWLIVFVPYLLLLQLMTGWGVGLFLSALNAQYRDVKHAVPFVMQTAMFLTVLLPLERWRTVSMGFLGGHESTGQWLLYHTLSLNPMAGVIDAYRRLLAEESLPSVELMIKATVVSIIVLAGGLRFFTARERRLADIL